VAVEDLLMRGSMQRWLPTAAVAPAHGLSKLEEVEKETEALAVKAWGKAHSVCRRGESLLVVF